ncbi:MAG: hypothetical protein ACI4NJ_00715 [Cellvibrio sp.]
MNAFDIELIQARLREPQFNFEVVEGAAEYAAIKDLPSFRAGSLYVVLINESGQGVTARSRVVQVTFGVISAAKNAKDARGEAAMRDAQQLISRVRSALMGFAPKGCTPIAWEEGSIQDYDRSHILWADAFSTTYVMGASNG